MRRRMAARFSLLLFTTLTGALLAAPGSADPLILNEYNAVSSGKWLNGGHALADEDGGLAADVTLGRIQGNGGDWFELVLTESGLDLRGWRLELWVEGALERTLVLSQDGLWTQLQAGTLITVAEDQAEDVSYDPSSDDWWINVRADNGASGTYITAISFGVNNDNWQLVIRDAAGVLQSGPAGEGIAGTGGVNSEEIYRLEENPSIFIEANSICYDDASSYSTFGLPNLWLGGSNVQDFGPLRTGGPVTWQCEGGDASAQAFDPDHLLDIEIVMDPADYEVLRRQQRTLLETFGGRCGDAPPSKPYTYFSADVTVDGTPLTNIGIRKKGFFGSVSRSKPAFKLDFKEFGSEQKVYGLERMTLNNVQQDPSKLDQCLGYALFRAAGMPASRCNFAHVKLNGESLGIYTHVEDVKDAFLVENFGESTGNLYEGAVSDFREHYIGTFEAKNGGDGSDLAAVQAALDIEDDAAALTALAGLVDLDHFLTFWALEGLIGNWDGYSGNSNNFFIYNNPDTGLFEFIPWSLDDIFGRDNPFSGGPVDSRTVFETASLTNRLWQMPGISAQYEARINQLIGEIWDEAALLAETDRMESLITPIAGDLSGAIDETRSWISGRADRVASDFSGGPPSYATSLPERTCLEIQGQITAGFSSTFTDPIPQGLPPGSSFDVETFNFAGGTSLTGLGAFFGGDVLLGTNSRSGWGLVTLRPLGMTIYPNALIFNIPIYEEDVVANTPEPIFVKDSIGSFLIGGNLVSFTFVPIGAIVNTEVEFDQADLTEGGSVSGSFSSDLAVWVPHPVPEPGTGLSYGVGLAALSLLARSRQRWSGCKD